MKGFQLPKGYEVLFSIYIPLLTVAQSHFIALFMDITGLYYALPLQLFFSYALLNKNLRFYLICAIIAFKSTNLLPRF